LLLPGAARVAVTVSRRLRSISDAQLYQIRTGCSWYTSARL